MDESSPPKKVLFICSRNRLRSPTAERIFKNQPGLHVRSAGIDSDSTLQVTRGLLEWADIIFVMEKHHRNALHRSFKDLYARKRIICLYIPDDFDYMDPELIELLKTAVPPFLK